MSITASPTIRQMELLLREKLIPWTQDGAPQVFFSTPPRGLMPLKVREEKMPRLKQVPQKHAYPHVKAWPAQGLNSIDVPVMGCIFDGQTDYQVRRPPGESGIQWTVPLQTKTFFLIPPNIPFTRGISNGNNAYARGILIHLRRESVSCFTYTIDRGKVWQNPYVLLHEFDAQLLSWRLLEEWRKPVLSSRIIYHYTSLILDLMLRAFQERRYTNVHGIATTPEQPNLIPASRQRPELVIQYAKTYITEHLSNADLSCAEIALNTGVSARHLERLFKREMDMAPFQYVQQQRLEKAQLLLLSPGLPIRHVAYYCGFRQASHFSRWFAQHTDRSPSDFRKQEVRKR